MMTWPTLKSRGQFQLVYSQGQKRTSSALVLFHLRSAPERQVAFVASRKVGGAVERSRAKRLLREGFRQAEWCMEFPSGWLVLVARRGILDLKSDQVAEQLRLLLAGLEVGSLNEGPAADPSCS